MDIASQFSSLTSSPEKLVATLTRYAPPLVSAVLVALIASLLASTTWLLVPRGDSVAPPPPDEASVAAGPTSASIDVQDIVARRLFGDPVDRGHQVTGRVG